jgi:hypothetical protein
LKTGIFQKAIFGMLSENALRDKDWDNLNNLDTEEAFNSFTSILNELIDEKHQ